MLVKNVQNLQSNIPTQYRQYAFNQNKEGKLPLTPEKKYVVSAVKSVNGDDFYLILSDDRELSASPWWYPASLFAVEDSNEPSDWISNSNDPSFTIRGFAEIVNDPQGEFYNALEDGDDSAIVTFLKYYKEYAQHHGILYADK